LVAPQYVARLESLGEVVGLAMRPAGVSVGNSDGATQGRITEMAGAALAFADNPVIGLGPAMYPVHYRRYSELVGGRVAPGERQAHSLYLGLGAEHGLLGLLAFGATLVVTFSGLNRARRRWRGRRPDLEMMATGLEASLIAYLANAIFLHFAYIRFFWLVVALAGVASYLALSEDTAPASDQPA